MPRYFFTIIYLKKEKKKSIMRDKGDISTKSRKLKRKDTLTGG
jgi:hypothetical protein